MDALRIAAEADANEISAITDWVSSMAPHVVAQFGVRLRSVCGAAVLAVPGTGTAYFNRVVGLGTFEPATRAAVRDAVAMYREFDTAFMVHVGPHSRPPELRDWLVDEGLAPGGEWLVLYRDGTPYPAWETTADIRITLADATAAETLAETMCLGYGMPEEWVPLYQGYVGRPGWMHYLAFDGAVPIATSALFHNGDIIWLGNTCTLPEYRGRGIQTALNHRRLLHGFDTGCRRFTGETWQPTGVQLNHSLRNHTKDGFTPAYMRTNYTFSPYMMCAAGTATAG